MKQVVQGKAKDEKSKTRAAEVTIDPEDKGNIRAANQAVTSTSSRTGTMAPKPALDKGRDNEHTLLAAASDEAHLAGKEMHTDDYSESGENSVVSYSDYSATDTEGEESVASSSRKERRSRQRRSSSRRRKSSRSRSRDSRSKSVERRNHKREEEEERRNEEDNEEDSVAPRRPSSASQYQGENQQHRVTMNPVNAGDQPYTKLLNFNTLYRTEQDRAPRYAEELERIARNWVNSKRVLERLLDEVKHANHLFHVSDVSFHQYSHVMYTIHKDIFLDDQGQRVLSSARQQLLLKQRGANNMDGAMDASSVLENGYLDPLYNSFSVLTDTMMRTVLDRESDNGKQAATIEFQEFCEELVTQAEAMRALGDSVVQEMEGSETDIQNSFDVLTHLASKTKTSKSSSVLDEDIKLGKPDKNFPKEMEYGGVNASAADWWLCETLYRAAVKHQSVSWDANLERMESLEESLAYFQEEHQKKLEKAVLAVMPQQREMFLVGAKSFESALQKTDAFSDGDAHKAALNHEKMAKEFDRGVQKRSTALMQEKSSHKSSILNRSKSKYTNAIEQAESDLAAKPLPAFGSPIMSKLVLEAKVIERWDKPGGWLTTVAIFTVDRYLHLFDCSDLDTKTMPQTAFASMFPTAASTRTNVHHNGGGRKKSKRATEHKIPNPSMTFNLVTCTLKTYGYARRSFEIKQVADPTAKTEDLPHTTLRFRDNPEATQWYALLQDLPDYIQREPAKEQTDCDHAQLEAEASHQKDLYDEIDAAELPEVYGEAPEEPLEVLQDISEMEAIQEEEGSKNDDGDDDGDDFGDAFEDASECVANGGEGAGRKAADDDEVQVETVDDASDDDSFQSC